MFAVASQSKPAVRAFNTEQEAKEAVLLEVGPIEANGIVNVHFVSRLGKVIPVLIPDDPLDLFALRKTGFVTTF